MRLETIKVGEIRVDTYNPRKMTKEQDQDLEESIQRFGIVDPLIINRYPGRENILIGGHQRLRIAKGLGYKEVPCVAVKVDPTREKELNLRLNRNLGEFDYDILAKFDEDLLKDVGFSSEELDEIFQLDLDEPESFDLQKELERLKIAEIKTKKGDIYQLGDHRLMCGDSTKFKDISKLMNGEKADFCFTDPPYILDYLHTKYKGKPSCTGFGYKANRRYLETNEAPTFDRWVSHIAKILKVDASIMVFENWKNIIPLWQEMEKYWRIRNMIIWHLTNRCQGFAAKYRFFNKYDIAVLANKKELKLNLEDEEGPLQNEYEVALYATQGKPHWEPYEKGKRFCPTDVVTFKASDKTSSGQGIIFGTKPVEILIPYIKVLTKRGDIVVEPFGGSGSTLMGCEKMSRICYLMELVPTYCEIIMRRWEKSTGFKRKRLSKGYDKA